MKQNLPDIIRGNEDLRQALLEQDGFMKYVTEHIDDGEDSLTLYARYQEHVYAVYRKENSWNPDAQLMSGEELWLVALGADNHLMKEFRSLKALERSLSGLPEEVADRVRGFYDGYMAYAWREYFERRNPEHCTDAGLYKVLMEQYLWPNGLAHRCMDIVLKEHHGKGLSEKDQYDYYRIAEYHYFYFDESGRQGKLAFNRLRRGVKEWLDGKDDEECRELAIDMLTKVRNFSQHIYNDEAVCSSNDGPFPLEDKRWLRQMAWDLGKKDTKACFYFCEFVQILAEIGHIWAARLLKKHNIDMHKLEEETYSFILPYTPKEDGYDYRYYVDHYYNTDNSNTCCVNNQNEAKELLYALRSKSFSKESTQCIAASTSQKEVEEPAKIHQHVDYDIQMFSGSVSIDKDNHIRKIQERRSKYWFDYNNQIAAKNATSMGRQADEGKHDIEVQEERIDTKAQQQIPLPSDCEESLPLTTNLDNSNSQKYFKKAMEKGYMKYENHKFIWLGVPKKHGKISQLAYFLGKIYGYKFDVVNKGNNLIVYGNTGMVLPVKDFNEMFGDHRWLDLLRQVYMPSRTHKIQAWRIDIDALFE